MSAVTPLSQIKAAAFVEARRRRAGAPAHVAIRPPHAKFGLEGVGVLGDLAECLHQQLKVFGIDERARMISSVGTNVFGSTPKISH